MLTQHRLLPRILKGAVVSCLALSVGPAILHAEDAPKAAPAAAGQPSAAGPQQYLTTMREKLNELNLSQDQKTKIDAIFAKGNEDLKKLVEDNTGDPQERMQKGRELFAGIKDQVTALLDETQKAKAKEVFGKGRGNGGGMEALATNLQKLDLTDAQKEKIKTLLDESKKKFDDLCAQGGGPNADRAAIAQKGQEAVQEMRAKLQEILTEEQAMKLKELMSAGKPAAAKPN